MITPYVTIAGRPDFERNKTGFGYMVLDIAKAVAKSENVELLATDSRGKDFTLDEVSFLKRSILSYLCCLFGCLSPGVVLGLTRRYHPRWGTLMRILFYWLMTGYIRQILETKQYDIVHIHGCNIATEMWMRVCKRCGQKYIVTLHGLNSFSDKVGMEPAGKQYERDFLQRVVDGEIPITVISSGMKRLVERKYGVEDCSNINVVCNSFSFRDSEKKIAVRKKYKIPRNGKVFLSVGNITKNKNQIQLVRAFSLLPETIQQHTYVLLCGRPDTSCGIEAEIAKQQYASHIIMCGGVDKAELPSYYQEADGVVLLSFAEGFGLSLIEGMHFGKPCVTFDDLASFDDIFDPCCVVRIHNREDEYVARAIEELLTREWDKEVIIKKSKQFEKETMAEKYISVYAKHI